MAGSEREFGREEFSFRLKVRAAFETGVKGH
jgi:hypothetical protein